MGVMIGAIMGLTGAGGGILAVPVLVGTLNWPMQTAAPVALIAVASGALVGAIDGFRLGLVRYKAAMLMALCGVPLTRLGQHWAQLLPHEGLMIGFGVLLWGVSARFFKQSSATLAQESSLSLHWARIHGETGKFIWTPVTALVLGLMGAAAALIVNARHAAADRRLEVNWMLHGVPPGLDSADIIVARRPWLNERDAGLQLARLDTRTGLLRNLSAGAPPHSISWLLDWQGEPRVIEKRDVLRPRQADHDAEAVPRGFVKEIDQLLAKKEQEIVQV